MSKLVPPHGGKGLVCRLLEGAELDAEKKKAAGLKKVNVTPGEKGDIFMMGIGAFSPLEGFMTKADWKSVCENFTVADGTFWPVPVNLGAEKAEADAVNVGDEIALYDPELDEIIATMNVTEKFELTEDEKKWECEMVYKGQGPDSTGGEFMKIALEDHPGVQRVMSRKPVSLAGPIKVLSEGEYPTKYKGIYLRPSETRKIFEDRGWSNVAALQLRNPMHRSHEYLCKIAVEVCDGVIIHSLIGNLKPGDIPAEVRVKCIDILVKGYFVEKNIVQGGYPLDMRYAGPREALLHSTFRQNYGVNRMLIGRDHAGVGDFYGLFEAQEIFDRIPKVEDVGADKALLCEPLKIDWTFYCFKCDGMASMRTCPHTKEDRVILSGTKLRKMLSDGSEIPDHFGRDEVLAELRKYYEGLTEKVEIKMQSFATGDAKV
ncbi:MAG: sulfate adenylyltransferase [Thermodesulfobacteriota bacterium]|nr:sulfate adenylyltransferase [Thermodesulfobacteriota bacterium]